jgi:8-oxo-dGTP pyrophosphatase MutT (NUDIX family)
MKETEGSMSTCFAAGTTARIHEGEAELLVLPFTRVGSNGTPLLKFPGGGCEKEDGRSLSATLIRELREEIAEGEFKVFDIHQIAKVQQGQDHTQHFFTFNFDGRLRVEDKLENDGIIIHEPRFCPAQILFRGRPFISSHRHALEEAILFYANKYEEFYWLAKSTGLWATKSAGLRQKMAEV